MQFFRDNFSNFFSKTVQKGRKVQKQSLKDVLGTGRSRNFKTKLAGLVKNLGNFLEKYILMNSSAIKLQVSLKLFQKMNSLTCMFQEFCQYFQSTFFQFSMVSSESIQNKRVIFGKLISIAPKNKF